MYRLVTTHTFADSTLETQEFETPAEAWQAAATDYARSDHGEDAHSVTVNVLILETAAAGKEGSVRLRTGEVVSVVPTVVVGEMYRAYMACALWSSNDYDDMGNGEPLDANYDVDDIAEETRDTMYEDCANFAREVEDAGLTAEYLAKGQTWEQMGHDFWLTREGHGAGFWDRGLGDLGERLTEMSKPHGSFDLYVGDDGKIYG